MALTCDLAPDVHVLPLISTANSLQSANSHGVDVPLLAHVRDQFAQRCMTPGTARFDHRNDPPIRGRSKRAQIILNGARIDERYNACLSTLHVEQNNGLSEVTTRRPTSDATHASTVVLCSLQRCT